MPQLSGKVHRSGRADLPAIPLRVCRFLDSGGRPFSGRSEWPLARASGHKRLDRLAALHQTIGPVRFSDQLVPCDHFLPVSRTYPSVALGALAYAVALLTLCWLSGRPQSIEADTLTVVERLIRTLFNRQTLALL